MVLVLSCHGSRCISHESSNSLQLEFFCKICIYFKYICYILFGGCACVRGAGKSLVRVSLVKLTSPPVPRARLIQIGDFYFVHQ